MSGQNKPSGNTPPSFSLYQIVARLYGRDDTQKLTLANEVETLKWLTAHVGLGFPSLANPEEYDDNFTRVNMRADSHNIQPPGVPLQAYYTAKPVSIMQWPHYDVLPEGYCEYNKFAQKATDPIERGESLHIARDDWFSFLERLEQRISENRNRPANESWETVLLRDPRCPMGTIKRLKRKTAKANALAEAYRKLENEWAVMAQRVVDAYKTNPFWDTGRNAKKISAPHVQTRRAKINSARKAYIKLFKSLLKMNPTAQALKLADPRVKKIMSDAGLANGELPDQHTLDNWASLSKSLNSPE